MHKLTLILFAFFSLVFPILAVPMSVPNEINDLAHRDSVPNVVSSHTGKGTRYPPGLGACNQTHSENEFIVAIPTNVFGSGLTHCRQTVNISFGDKSVLAATVDKCSICGDQDIEMSLAVFEKLSITADVTNVTWSLLATFMSAGNQFIKL